MARVKPVWWRKKGGKVWHRDVGLESPDWAASERNDALRKPSFALWGGCSAVCQVGEADVSRSSDVEPKCPKCAKA